MQSEVSKRNAFGRDELRLPIETHDSRTIVLGVDLALTQGESRTTAMFTFSRHAFLTSALILFFSSTGSAQTPATNQETKPPVFKVQIWGSVLADFNLRVQRYSELRSWLEIGLPPLRVTADPSELIYRELALAERIRLARLEATEGEFFTPPISDEFKRVLLIQIDVYTWDSLMDDNPGEFDHAINGTYPKTKPLSTVPPNILAALPSLPDGIQYRFLGRHLVLHDTRANVILDRISYAVQCTDCHTPELR
jgi:hypothetical protein